MSDEIPIGPNPCRWCGGEYGEHAEGCSSLAPARCSATGTYIKFMPMDPKPKTKVWAVTATDGSMIGTVSWYGPWRKYCYSPQPGTVYEQVCLREVVRWSDWLNDGQHEYKI